MEDKGAAASECFEEPKISHSKPIVATALSLLIPRIRPSPSNVKTVAASLDFGCVGVDYRNVSGR